MDAYRQVTAYVAARQQQADIALFWKSMILRLFFLIAFIGVGKQIMGAATLLM